MWTNETKDQELAVRLKQFKSLVGLKLQLLHIGDYSWNPFQKLYESLPSFMNNPSLNWSSFIDDYIASWMSVFLSCTSHFRCSYFVIISSYLIRRIANNWGGFASSQWFWSDYNPGNNDYDQDNYNDGDNDGENDGVNSNENEINSNDGGERVNDNENLWHSFLTTRPHLRLLSLHASRIPHIS